MKILTKDLKQYSKLFEKIRIQKHLYYGAVFLDIENDFLYFQNRESAVRIPLLLNEKDPNIKSINIIDGEKFFYLVNNYDHIIYDGKSFISADGNKFNFSKSEDVYEIPNFDSSNDWSSINMDFNADLLFHIRNASLYADINDSPMSGLFFENNKLIAIQPSKFYQAEINQFSDEISFPLNFIKILSSLSFPSVEIFYKKVGNTFQYIVSNEISIKFSSNSKLSIPVSIDNPDFIASYNHPTYLTVDKSILLQSIRFLDPFSKDIVNSKALIKFYPSLNEMQFIINDNSNNVEYNIPVEFYSDHSYFKDAEMYFSIQSLNSILSSFNKDKIFIFFDKNKPAVKFSTDINSDYFIIHTRIKQE